MKGQDTTRRHTRSHSRLYGNRREPTGQVVDGAYRLAVELAHGDALGEGGENSGRFQARETLAGAGVDTGAERDVIGVAAGDVEGVGLGEAARVAVGGAVADQDPGAGRCPDSLVVLPDLVDRTDELAAGVLPYQSPGPEGRR